MDWVCSSGAKPTGNDTVLKILIFKFAQIYCRIRKQGQRPAPYNAHLAFSSPKNEKKIFQDSYQRICQYMCDAPPNKKARISSIFLLPAVRYASTVRHQNERQVC